MKLILSALLLAYSSISFAKCTPTQAPELPSGESAELEAMVAGQKTVKAYVAATEEYLECLTAQAREAGEEVSAEQRAMDVDTYNAAVDEMEAVAAKFNEEIRAYKAKSQ
jgi:hypothetical protein